jgi:DNA-binding transcriptional regulator YiaG
MTIFVHSGAPEREEIPLRQRRSRAAAAATEFGAALDALGIAQRQAARLFNVNMRHIRRWRHGDRRVPRGVSIVLNLLIAQKVTLAEVEQAAIPVPARTNGRAKSKPPAPVFVEPAPEQSTLAPAHANSSLTTAEKVYALASEACRWPCGDPRHPDFYFCSNPVAEKPYCDHHRAMAYMTPQTGGGHGARIRLVA